MVHHRLAELEQALRQDVTARAGHDLAKYPVGFPGPDIVRADTEYVSGNVVEHVSYQRHHRMIGRGTDIDDVVAALEPLIARRMPEQSLGAFDDRNHLFARRRCVAPDDVVDLFGADEIVAGGMIGRDHAAGIAQVRGKCEIELVALVDLVDGHQRALLHFSRHHGVRSRSRKYESEGNGGFGHQQSPGSCKANCLIAINNVGLSPVVVNQPCASFALPA